MKVRNNLKKERNVNSKRKRWHTQKMKRKAPHFRKVISRARNRHKGMETFDKIQRCSTHTYNGANLKYYSTLKMKRITSLCIEFIPRGLSHKEANPNFKKHKQKAKQD